MDIVLTRHPALRLPGYAEPANGDLVGIAVTGGEAEVEPCL